METDDRSELKVPMLILHIELYFIRKNHIYHDKRNYYDAIIKNSLNYYTTTQIETISKVHRHTSFVKVCSGLMRRRHCASAGDERSLIRHAPELIAPEYGRVWMMV